ncbi:MAG TPA: methylated-DNA--[protein]-cysteine S-methyltransferase [Bacilli bacterium]
MELSKINNQVYWTNLLNEHGHFHIAATSKGLCYVSSPNVSFTILAEWVNRTLPTHQLKQDDEMMMPYTTQIREYFQGSRTKFELYVDLYGTIFQKSVWGALSKISYGNIHSYSQIADLCGNPLAVRAVGAAIGANPLLIVIPCHRVIGKSGTLTGYRGGLEAKRGLLQLEGIQLSDKSIYSGMFQEIR